MNILFVTPYVPSRIRTRPYHVIRALRQLGHRVTLLTAASGAPDEGEPLAELRAWDVQVEAFPVSLPRSLGNCLRALPTREPLQAAYAYHPAMDRRLQQLLGSEAFDVVHIEHLRAARFLRTVNGTPRIYDSVDCISLLFEQTARTGTQWRSRMMATLDLARTRRYEAQLLTRCDHAVVTSQRDREALEELATRLLPPQARPAPVAVVSNGVDLAYFRPPEGPVKRGAKTVIFTGKMSYHANVAAALHFAREVLPRIWARDPQVRFQVVGKDPPEPVRQLAADRRIEVTGTVPDLRPYLARATVAVCPVVYAVGIQNKVLEAMAVATPVVCTPAAFAGLSAQRGKDLLVADGSDAFAAQVLRVCSDPSLAATLARSGRRYVEAHHDWAGAARQLTALYERACLRRASCPQSAVL